MKNLKFLAALLLLLPFSQMAKADLCMDPTTHGYVTCPVAATTAVAGSSVTSTGAFTTPHHITCTNGSTGVADTAMLVAAAALGGNIELQSNCTINATVTLISNTNFNGNGFTVTAAAAANWAASTITHGLAAASSATQITVQNTNFVWTGASGSVHIIQIPSANSQISILNNTSTGAGDLVASIGATDVSVIGNKAYACSNACIDNWNGSGYLKIIGNTASLVNTVTNGYGILVTGFNTNNSAGTSLSFFTIADNNVLLNGQAVAGQVGIYVQGYASSYGGLNNEDGSIHDNTCTVASGIWGECIRGTGYINNVDIHDNVFWSDGLTTSSLPAIEIGASGPTNIWVHNNHANNWVGQTGGSDRGVFTNKGTGGSLAFNTCTGTCSSPLDYVSSSTTIQQVGDDTGTGTTAFTSLATFGGGYAPVTLFNWGVAVGIPPSGFFANNGVYVIGQVPSNSATLSVSGTSGSVTATFSAATLLGTAADVGRVITLLDTTYKYCTITAQSSTTVATCTISGGSWSGTGPFTNASIKLSGTPTTNTTAFSVPFPRVYASIYLNFPVNVISASTAAGVYYAVCQSTTVCTVYNNALASGVPTVQASPTAFSVTGTGAFSQLTSALTLLTLTVPANSMGAGGSLVWDVYGERNSNTDTVALQTFFGGTQSAQLSVVSVVWYGLHRTMRNMGATNVQTVFCATCSAVGTDATTSNNTTSNLAIDTTASATWVEKAILTTAATDWWINNGGSVVANYVP